MNMAESEGGGVEEADPVFGLKIYKDGNGSVKRAPAMRIGKRDGHPVRLVRMFGFVDGTRDDSDVWDDPQVYCSRSDHRYTVAEANPMVKP